MKQICKNGRTQTQLHTRNFSQLSAIKKIACLFFCCFWSDCVIQYYYDDDYYYHSQYTPYPAHFFIVAFVCLCVLMLICLVGANRWKSMWEREPSSENSLCLSVCFMWICFSILTSWPIRSQCARRNKWMKWEKEKRRRKNAAELNDIHQKPFQIFN